MTFAKIIKILDLLDHDKTIAIKVKDDWGGFYLVDKFSKYDEISDYMKYFTDKKIDYHFFAEDNDGLSNEEIEDD